MSAIMHHVPDPLMAAYAAGSLGHGFDLAVAAHVSMCDDCRAQLAAHQSAGGAVLEGCDSAAISGDLRARVMAGLTAPAPTAPARCGRQDIYPGPVAQALGGQPPRWRSIGRGGRQCILHDGPDGVARLLYLPASQVVPEHGHNGLELTLVLQGSFHDETGKFGVGDLAVADAMVDHTPTTGPGEACICLAVSDAPLRFAALIPRLTQRLFRF